MNDPSGFVTLTDCSNRKSAGVGHAVPGGVVEGVAVGLCALTVEDNTMLAAKQHTQITADAQVIERRPRPTATA